MKKMALLSVFAAVACTNGGGGNQGGNPYKASIMEPQLEVLGDIDENMTYGLYDKCKPIGMDPRLKAGQVFKEISETKTYGGQTQADSATHAIRSASPTEVSILQHTEFDSMFYDENVKVSCQKEKKDDSFFSCRRTYDIVATNIDESKLPNAANENCARDWKSTSPWKSSSQLVKLKLENGDSVIGIRTLEEHDVTNNCTGTANHVSRNLNIVTYQLPSFKWQGCYATLFQVDGIYDKATGTPATETRRRLIATPKLSELNGSYPGLEKFETMFKLKEKKPEEKPVDNPDDSPVENLEQKPDDPKPSPDSKFPDLAL